MKYKLLAVEDCREINIGDYIQAVAAAQFLPSVDGFIQREHLDEYNEDDAIVIMNGYFMHQPEHWPPSKKIHPIYVSFHINPVETKGKMLNDKGIKHFLKYAPIGCRDKDTVKQLQNKGIEAYFSGCLTLTLGQSFHSEEKEDKCYFVDPYFRANWTHKHLLYNIGYYILNYKTINTISSKLTIPGRFRYMKNNIHKKLRVVDFFREYSKYFTKETLVDAEYITHDSKKYKDDFKTDKERLNEAERLIKKYSKARLVVTSRIHCALPCLGMETPVIYVEDGSKPLWSIKRLDGLRELFNLMIWNKGELHTEFIITNKISINNPPQNSTKWKSLYNNLYLTVKEKIKHS